METLLKTLSTRTDPAGTIVTLALDLSKSGRIPDATRVFLKDQVYENLSSEARPEKSREFLRRLSRRIQRFVEREVRPETDGLFLVAGPELWEAVELRVPLRNLIVVGRAPYLPPLMEATRRAPRAYVVALGARDGSIQEFFRGENVKSVQLGASEPVENVEHAVGGAERDLWQRRMLEASKALAREAAARVAALHRAAPAEAILLAKPSGTFVDHLPGDLRSRVAPLAREGVAWTLARAYEARVAAEVEAFKEARERGLRAALGPREVLEALASGRVERVFLDPDDPRPGVACVACGGRFPELRGRCPYCEGDVVGASMTQEVVAYALARPPLALTFVRTAEPWLAELGGMTALLKMSRAKAFAT
ncbi:MAG TPA: hypothetical protein VF950_29145 [Planctomycetota bacterium]